MKKQAETYATINIADLALIDFAQIGETDENTIRKSLDESAICYQVEHGTKLL